MSSWGKPRSSGGLDSLIALHPPSHDVTTNICKFAAFFDTVKTFYVTVIWDVSVISLQGVCVLLHPVLGAKDGGLGLVVVLPIFK